MPSVAEELAALRKQSLAKTQASKLKDARGLSTPEQEEAQIKGFQEKKREYSKDAKQTLATGGSNTAAQDLEFQRQLTAAKKQDKVKIQQAKQTLAAGTKAVDKTLEFQQQSIALKRAEEAKKKEAAEQLNRFNEAKIKVASASSTTKAAGATAAKQPPSVSNTKNTAPATAKEEKVADNSSNKPEEPTPAAVEANVAPTSNDDEKGDDNDDNVPDLEEVEDIPTLETEQQQQQSFMPDMTLADNNNNDNVRTQNRAEKKARKVMERLQMRPVPGITRVTLKTTGGGGVFTIFAPDVFEKNGSYIVFGEARQGGMGRTPPPQQQQQQQQAAQQLAAATTIETISMPQKEEQEDTTVDETGLDAKDIELVIQQAGCSRAKAVTALKENDGDLVNAIMALTK